MVRHGRGYGESRHCPSESSASQSSSPNAGLTGEQRANRRLLADAMQAHGFEPYPAEWWHFTLDAEPYPETYFDFPVR